MKSTRRAEPEPRDGCNRSLDTKHVHAVCGTHLGLAKLTAVAHQQGAESRVPFAVESIDTPSTGDAALRVHISLDGDENVLARDLVSTSHNSATGGRSLEIAVKTV